MEIIKVRVEDVKPYEKNAKLHPREQIEQIKRSIREFGNNDPIAIDENGTIIEGHGRFQALLELGYTEVECIRLTHMTDEQKRAYILVHNKLTMNTGFDYNILDAELAEINDIDMTAFSFDGIDVAPEDFGEDFSLNTSETPTERLLRLSFNPKQLEILQKAIQAAVAEGLPHRKEGRKESDNAVAEIVHTWAEDRGIL